MKLSSPALLAALAATVLTTMASAAKPDCAPAQELFKQRCSACHAPDGTGYAAIHTPNFSDAKWQAAHTDAELIHSVTNGKTGEGNMPAFKDRLTAEQIDALVLCAVRGFAPKTTARKGGRAAHHTVSLLANARR
ncbi:MAG: c-type cytochrome [Terriglobales bacterium]